MELLGPVQPESRVRDSRHSNTVAGVDVEVNCRFDSRGEPAEAVLGDGSEQIVFVREVPIRRGMRNARARGDLTQGECRDTTSTPVRRMTFTLTTLAGIHDTHLVLAAVTLLLRAAGVAGLHLFEDWSTCLRCGPAAMFFLTASAHWGKRRADLIRMVPAAVPRPDIAVTVTGVLELLGGCGPHHRADSTRRRAWPSAPAHRSVPR